MSSIDVDEEIHENVAVNLVDYVRSSTIRNEQQFLAVTLAYASGLALDTHDYISSVLIGTSSSGKSHLKGKVDNVYEGLEIMDASTGSDKALIYDDDWDKADVISMGELQQPGEEMLEFMKRAHGGDEEVVIRSTRGNPAEGFETKKIVKKAKSYHFTFAQFNADFEFWNRLLKVPVHESESKNRAVGRMEAGHTGIQLPGDDTVYGYPYDETNLQNHMASVKANAPKIAILPTGDEYSYDAWDIIEPMFNHSRSESNRVYAMVINLLKGSAIVNYHSREHTSTMYDGTSKKAVVVAPQDIANILSCMDILRATTHEIDSKKRAIQEAIRNKSGPDNAIEGVGPIREFLKEADAPEVKKEELENILGSLEQNFLVDIQEDAGEGGKNVYRAFKMDALGQPRVDKYAELFEDCIDPIENEPFLEAWENRRSAVETTAQDMLKSATMDERTGSSSSNEDGDSGLSSFGGGVSTEEPDVELDDWVETVRDRIAPVIDSKRARDLSNVPIESFLGMTSLNTPDKAGLDVTGTMLDPDHDVWDQSNHADNWISNETQARMKIQEAIDVLIDEQLLEFETIHATDGNDQPVDVTLSIQS